jgi:hypothetical protein
LWRSCYKTVHELADDSIAAKSKEKFSKSEGEFSSLSARALHGAGDDVVKRTSAPRATHVLCCRWKSTPIYGMLMAMDSTSYSALPPAAMLVGGEIVLLNHPVSYQLVSGASPDTSWYETTKKESDNVVRTCVSPSGALPAFRPGGAEVPNH